MWQTLRQVGSVTDRITTQVEQLVVNGDLKLGDRLPSERELAQLLGVSRPSLREAVRLLQARCLLVVKHGQGVFVAEPQAAQALRAATNEAQHDVDELFAMREVLELPAAEWAAERITDDDLATLRALLDDLEAAFVDRPDDFAHLAQLDAGYHLAIADIASNHFLAQTSHVLHDILLSGMKTTLLIPGRQEKSRQEHERIFTMLQSHNSGGARRAARTHIRSAHRAARRSIAGGDGTTVAPEAVA